MSASEQTYLCGLRFEWTIRVTVCVTLAIGPIGSAQESGHPTIDAGVLRNLDSELGETFRVVNSAHFELFYDIEEPAARRRLEWMEGTYERFKGFCTRFGLAVTNPDQRFQAVCFGRWSEFEKLVAGTRTTIYAGFYDTHHRRTYFGISSDQDGVDENLGNELDRMAVQHETAHQLLDALHPRSRGWPDWLVEGIACQFEGVSSDADGDAFKNIWRARDAAGVDPAAEGASLSEAQRYALAWSVVHRLDSQHDDVLREILHFSWGGAARPATDVESTAFQDLRLRNAELWRDVQRLSAADLGRHPRRIK